MVARRILVVLVGADVACGGGSAAPTSAPEAPKPPVPESPAIATLRFNVQPADVYAGAPLAPVIEVAALFPDGSPARQFGGSVTLWISDSTAGLDGATTMRASGVARFRDVWVTQPGRYTLHATADAAGGESAAFQVLALPRMAYNACFTSVRLDFDEDIYACTAAGVAILNPPNSVASLSPSDDSYSWDPVWSADGTHIAMVGTRGCPSWSSPCTLDLFSVSVDTRSETRLTHGEFDTLATPAWSPDGRRLMFSAIRSDSVSAGSRIYTVNRDGSQITPLASLRGEGAVWSPDGTRIAFAAPYSGKNRAIWIANADGSAITRAVQTDLDDYAPAWSPDGRRIAFTRVWRHSNVDECQILVVDVDGASGISPTQLTHDPGCANMPAWSPDGRQLTYNGSDQALNRGIMLMNADGTGAKLLRRSGWWLESRAAWAPLATAKFNRR